ncbi:hypothetical protein [Massilia cavernae]|nr:hypothetical protein [Massilia cavernae]
MLDLVCAVSDAKPINNVRLQERFRASAQCESKEQEAVIRLISAVTGKHCAGSAMQSMRKLSGHAKDVA